MLRLIELPDDWCEPKCCGCTRKCPFFEAVDSNGCELCDPGSCPLKNSKPVVVAGYLDKDGDVTISTPVGKTAVLYRVEYTELSKDADVKEGR